MAQVRLELGDCLDVLKTLDASSVNAVVTDPPYGLSFMGKAWDYDVPSVAIWQEVYRVLKPGGYLLSFAGTRTQHRMAVAIEDAGFEIRDMIAWVYGSGFPKSLNIGKAVDKVQGNEREQVGTKGDGANRKNSPFNVRDGWNSNNLIPPGKLPQTKGTSEWEGWGTALKPALEPITVARKPIEGTVAENCLKWGVGGIDIDGSRVGTEEHLGRPQAKNSETNPFSKGLKSNGYNDNSILGRFPANLIHDGSEEVVGLFPNNSARFFYSPKASKSERNMGCEGMEEKESVGKSSYGLPDLRMDHEQNRTPNQNHHPTVKPIALMEYLVNMVSREGQTVLDPFLGSGSTGIACTKLGRDFIGIEREAEYLEIAKARIAAVPQRLL